jgi:PadR family transcriptional regulator PadR
MTMENWQEQLRRGGLDLAILSTVAPEPRYGFEIIRHLKESTDLVVAEGTIYPILGRLTREGLLSARWNASEGSHPRKYYQLTASGRRVLDDMTGHWREFTKKIDRLLKVAEEERR